MAETEIPISGVNDIITNLKNAAKGEYSEHSHDYPHFADIADKEGFPKIVKAFRSISLVEKAHEERFNKLAKQLEANTLFKRDRMVTWKCRNCGFIIYAFEAPTVCPVCFKPQGWFKIQEVID